jgi:hypothetical protein
MEIIKLKKTNILYELTGGIEDAKTLYDLSFFILQECYRGTTPKFINWINRVNHNGYEYGCSYHTLLYENGKIIVIYDADLDEGTDLEQKNQINFITTKEHMLEILSEWDRIINLDPLPEEVILTYDGKRVGFVASNKSIETKGVTE